MLQGGTRPPTGRPLSVARRGIVASPHSLATGAGVDVLRRGGSAVDAVVAASAVLCVVYPHMAGLGGDGFWSIRAPGDVLTGINASGPAGARATARSYRDLGFTDTPPVRGGRAALTVSGAVDGWREAHDRFGRLPWRDLFADAVVLAGEGAPVARSLAQWIAEDASLLASSPEAARVFLPDGVPLSEGQALNQPDLARSLLDIAHGGARDGFYEGPLARRLCGALAQVGSPLVPEDLAAYRAHTVGLLTASYRGWRVHQMPPNTQGLTALQILRMLEGFPVGSWDDRGADLVHHAAEVTKLALADRNAWLGDPDRADVPVAELLDDGYLAGRRSMIDPSRAMDVEQVASGIPGAVGRPGGVAEGDTCALSAIDSEGLTVSAIISVYHDFGAGLVAGDTGIVPQNRGSIFSLDPSHPNSLEPGKRPAHTLIPALLDRDGQDWVALGAMGGEGQPQTHAAVITRLVDFGLDLQEAIEAPRWLMGRTWGDPSQNLLVEAPFGPSVGEELRSRGQPVRMTGQWSDRLGHAQAVALRPATGMLEGAADPRGDGAALGW